MSGARRSVAAIAAMLVLACASLAAAQPVQDSAPGADSLRAAADSLRVARADSAEARLAAPADTANALQRFLRQLSDSTARAYGAAAAPLDTAGLDSALAVGLMGEAPRTTRRGRPVELSPWFQFARVDGPVMGGTAAIGRRAKLGRAAATLGWASGPDLPLGGGQYEKRWGRPQGEESWTFTAAAGRSTDVLDLDRRRQLFSTMSAFVLGNDRQLKLFGLGMAVAVFVDATVVRMILVPATMELLGNKNWWIPRWIDRILPKIDVEGHSHLHEGEGAGEVDDDRQPELV